MKIENRQQWLLVVAIAAVTLLFCDRVIIEPLRNVWKKRALEVAKLRTEVAEGNGLIRRAQVIRSLWERMQTNTLPNNPSLAQEQLLKAFENWSQESGVGINAITPQWKSDSDDYMTLVCRVDASGTLWTLSRFIYDIEKGPMALKLEAVDLSSRDNNGRQLTLGLQVSGLVLTPPSK